MYKESQLFVGFMKEIEVRNAGMAATYRPSTSGHIGAFHVLFGRKLARTPSLP
jgi:hypothetical protein